MNELEVLDRTSKPTGDLYIPQDPASNQNAWLYSHGYRGPGLVRGVWNDPRPRVERPSPVGRQVYGGQPGVAAPVVGVTDQV